MSKLIPQNTVTAIRGFNDTIVDIYGIDCTLYVPSNLDAIDNNTAYQPTLAYTTYTSQKVFIEWAPENKRLRKLGIYAEDQTPIIAWFKHSPMVVIKSYITVSLQYVPSSYDTEAFEIVDMLVKQMHDMELVRCVKLAPRRV
jgi:hypothetical protein